MDRNAFNYIIDRRARRYKMLGLRFYYEPVLVLDKTFAWKDCLYGRTQLFPRCPIQVILFQDRLVGLTHCKPDADIFVEQAFHHSNNRSDSNASSEACCSKSATRSRSRSFSSL